MNFELNALFSFSIGIGTIIGWIRVKKTDPAFLPFLFYISLGLANEILSIMIMRAGFSNSINHNLFSLAEALLLTWQFQKWNLFNGQNKKYYALQIIFIAGWLFETSASSKEHLFNSYFIIGHSAIIVLMSVNMINRVMFEDPYSLFLNPIFLICMSLIIFFTYAILVETFWVYGLNKTRIFRNHIYGILPYINLFSNLVFALAILCIPLKRQYILRS